MRNVTISTGAGTVPGGFLSGRPGRPASAADRYIQSGDSGSDAALYGRAYHSSKGPPRTHPDSGDSAHRPGGATR